MKKHYTLYNIGKLLILSCVLLLGGTEVAMGQRINPQPDKTFPQENVPTLVDLKSATIIQYTIKGRFMSR